MFTVKCFSDSSSDKYSNNELNSFTMDLEHPIVLDSEYEVAVSAVYLNKILNMNNKSKIVSRDAILCNEKNRYYNSPTKFSEFIEELLLLSSHPEIYHKGYFVIDKTSFLSTKNLDLYVEKDLIPKSGQAKISFNLNLQEILPPHSSIEEFISPIFTSNEREKLVNSYKKIALSLRQSHAYTLQQVLIVFLYQFITSISNKSESYSKHLSRFESHMKDFDSAFDHAHSARVSWDSNHDLGHFFIAYFIEQVQVARAKILLHEQTLKTELNENPAEDEEKILKHARDYGVISDFTQALSSKRLKRKVVSSKNTSISHAPSSVNEMIFNKSNKSSQPSSVLNSAASHSQPSPSSDAALSTGTASNVSQPSPSKATDSEVAGKKKEPTIVVSIESSDHRDEPEPANDQKKRISEALKMNKKRNIGSYGESRFICIYTDIIKEQIVGNKSARMLFLTTLKESMENSNLLFNRVDSLSWASVEKKVISSISFKISDEYGRLLQISNEFSNILIELTFRKVSPEL